MNSQDRQRIARVAAALSAPPFGHDGMGGPTASIKGAMGFQRDMRHLRQRLVNALYAIASGEVEEFEEEMRQAEQYIEQQQANNWD